MCVCVCVCENLYLWLAVVHSPKNTIAGGQDEDLFFVVTAKYTLLNQLILILLNHPHASIFRQAC